MDIRPEQTVADLVIRHPEWREKMEKMGIDYCCGGKRPLEQAVAAAGLDGLLAKVEAAHGAKHGEMLARLRRLYDGLHGELDAHLMKEEQILFPAITRMDAFVHGKGGNPVVHSGSVANPIRQMEAEHGSAGEALAGMRSVQDGRRQGRGKGRRCSGSSSRCLPGCGGH